MQLKLISLFGLVVFLGIAWAISSQRKLFPWRTVLWGLALQFTFAILILKTAPGRALFAFTGGAIRKLADFATEGTQFVFGPLANAGIMGQSFGPQNALVLGILILGTIIVVAMLSSLFFHWGVLQKIVHGIAWVMRKDPLRSDRFARCRLPDYPGRTQLWLRQLARTCSHRHRLGRLQACARRGFRTDLFPQLRRHR
jgi:nucleoside permease NupC